MISFRLSEIVVRNRIPHFLGSTSQQIPESNKKKNHEKHEISHIVL